MDHHRTQPPEILHMLAHPLRWQLVQALMISDKRVQELIDEVLQPNNLVSYHLKLLRTNGWVTLRRSDADHRDLYYHLNIQKIAEAYQAAGQVLLTGSGGQLFPRLAQPSPVRVLFLCTSNSARSQIAEGLLRFMGSDRYYAASAGSQPAQVHPEAIQAMAAYGIDITPQRSKPIGELADLAFDLVVTVCDRMREDCGRYPACQHHLHWSIPDPVAISDPEQRLRAFNDTVINLENRIRRLINQLTGPAKGFDNPGLIFS